MRRRTRNERRGTQEDQSSAFNGMWSVEVGLVNGNVFVSFHVYDLCTSGLGQEPEKAALRIALTSLVSFFAWSNKNAAEQKNNKYAKQSLFHRQGEFFKEGAGQPDGKDCFGQIGHDFSDKFPSGFVNDSHGNTRVAWTDGGVKRGFPRPSRAFVNGGLGRDEGRIVHRPSSIIHRLMFVLCFILFFIPVAAMAAADKTWIGAGDNVSWEDKNNWLPKGEPIITESVVVDKKDSTVVISQTFKALSLLVGGRNASLRVQDFVSGEINPQDKTAKALYIKKGGLVTLISDGQITLKGSFLNTEETSTSEPAFMFSVE